MRYIETYEVRRMTHSQESRVSSSQDALLLRQENRSNVSVLVNDINSCMSSEVVSNNDQLKVEKMAATSNQEGKKSDSVYPWLSSFGDACHAALGGPTPKKLEILMKKYTGYILGSVKECYTRPNRAAKLRKCINDTLLFFHLYYQDVREPGKHSTYLDVMTELVSMYVDMEIKAASRRKERVKKITCRLTSALYIFLDKSEDHVLDAILKAKLISKHNRDVCLPLLGKIVSQVPSPLNEMAYVRYLMIFKLLKKVTQNAEKGKDRKAEEGKRINKLALLKLKPPANFVEKSKIFNNVLPKIPPKSKKNITHFFMQAKFNLKSACNAFLKSTKELQQALYGSASKEALFSKSITADLSGKSECNIAGSNANETWSSLHLKSLVENVPPPRNVASPKKEPVVKKAKEKVKKKNKKIKGVKNKEKDLEKIRKKKLKKNKIVDPCGESVTVLENKLQGSKKGKGDKNKKKSNVKKESVVLSCESTDESVSLPESSLPADSVHRDLSVFSNLTSKGLTNILVSSGKSYSSGDSHNLGSSGMFRRKEISNGEDLSEYEVSAATSVSGGERECSSNSTPSHMPAYSARSTVCSALPPLPRPCYTSPPPPPPQTPSHEVPSTTTPRGGPSYMKVVPSEYPSTHPPKRNTDVRSTSPATSCARSSPSPHMSVCSTSMTSPRRNLNICSGLPADFSPSIPPPPLPTYPPHPTAARHAQNAAPFQPPLPRSPAPLPPPLPTTPAPPGGFSLPFMSLPPPSLALFSTIPPPPPPPLSHSIHLPGHPLPPILPVRPSPTPPNHPPSTPPSPIRPPPTPPPPPSVPPPPPPTVTQSGFSSLSVNTTHFTSTVSMAHPPSSTPSSSPTFAVSNSHSRVLPTNVPASHTPPLRSFTRSSPLPSNIPSPHTPYVSTPPPSCTPTPPSPSTTPPPSPCIRTRPPSSPALPSPSLTPTPPPPPLRSLNSGPAALLISSLPSTSSVSVESVSASSPSPRPASFSTYTPTSPSPPTPSCSPSPSHSLSNSPAPSYTPVTLSCAPTPSSPMRTSTPPTSCMTVSSLYSSIESSSKLPSSNIPSQSISPSSASPSCTTAFSTYTPASPSPSPSPSPSCSPSPSPSRSPSPFRSPSPSLSPSRSPSPFRSPSPSPSSSPSHSPSPSPESSPSPSYTPIALSPSCTPTPSSPVCITLSPTPCVVTSVHSSVASATNLSDSTPTAVKSLPSPVGSRSSTPLRVCSPASVQSVPSCTTPPVVSLSNFSSQTSNTVSTPSSPLVGTTSLSTSPSLPNVSEVQTNKGMNVAVSVVLTEASATQTQSSVSSLTTPQTKLTPEQPTTTTFLVDSPSKADESSVELHATPIISKNKGPCDSSPALLDPTSVIPCYSSSLVAPSEERIVEVGAEVEVEVEDEAETEVEADTVVSVEESQESVIAGNNREISVADEASGNIKKEVTCDSAGENMILGESDEVYSNECEAVEPTVCVKGKIFSVEQFNNVDSVIAPLGQNRGTVIASGRSDSLRPTSSGIDSKGLVASHICKSEVQENEAIACGNKPEKVCRETVSPRIVRDPVLVPSPIPNDTESEAVAYSCDSSMPNVPLTEDCSPTNNEDLCSVQMDIDADRDIMESFTTFVPVTTTNDEIVNEMIADPLLFGYPNIMTLDTSHQEEREPDSPAIEKFDHRDRTSLQTFMMYFGEVQADFAHFGRERQDNMVQDSMLHHCNIIMENDGVQEGPEETPVSSDDEHDESFNSSPVCGYNRRRYKGGKHPAPGVASEDYSDLLDEKDVSDASPSSSVENESVLHSPGRVNSSYSNAVFSRNDNVDNRKERLPPETPKVNTMGSIRIHHSSTPKRTPEVNNYRYYSSVEQTLQISSSESREDSSAEESPCKVPKALEFTRNNIPHGINVFTNCTVEVKRTQLFPDVVRDAHEAERQREQEQPSKATRGMLSDTNVSRGKLGHPYMDTMYRGAPLQAPGAPTSIPYPAITNQMAVDKGTPPVENTLFRCTCSECYANYLVFLSGYSSVPPGGPPLPMPVHNPPVESETDKMKSAEKLKSEDEELLRRIEESLAKNKLDEILDSKYKPELDSSLPLKKRLKTITAVSKIKSEPVDKWDNLKEDSFPSYPTKPMISIAELDFTERLFSKHVQRPIKTVMSNNPQRYLPYAYFQQMQQGKEVGKFPNDIPQYQECNAEVSSTVNVPVGNVGREVPVYQCCPAINQIPATEKSTKRLPPVQQLYITTTTTTNTLSTITTTTSSGRGKCQVTETKNVSIKVEAVDNIKLEPPVIHPNSTIGSWEYSGRQFKTPAQLKEIPAVNYYLGMPVIKCDGNRSDSNGVSNTGLCVPKLNSGEEVKYGFSQFNKPHALDLSTEEAKNIKEQRSRWSKSNVTGESIPRSKSSKRNSRNQSVNQNFIPSNVYFPAEKKNHRKQVSR